MQKRGASSTKGMSRPGAHIQGLGARGRSPVMANRSFWALCLASIVVFAVVFIGRESGEAEKEFEETAVGGGTAPTLRVASWNMAVGDAQPKIGYLALNLRAPRPGHQ